MANYNRPGVVTDHQKNAVLAWWKKVTAANPKAENFKRLQVPVVGKFGKKNHSTFGFVEPNPIQCRYPLLTLLLLYR